MFCVFMSHLSLLSAYERLYKITELFSKTNNG